MTDPHDFARMPAEAWFGDVYSTHSVVSRPGLIECVCVDAASQRGGVA